MNAMTTDDTTRHVLERCLLDINLTYLDLLKQAGALEQCQEAGRTVRSLAQCVAEYVELPDEDESDDLDEILSEADDD